MTLVEAGSGPKPPEGRDNWDQFLKRHADTLWQCDEITTPMWTMTGIVVLCLIVFIHIGTRRVWISPGTQHPTSHWGAQQARNIPIHAEDVTGHALGRGEG